MASPHSRQRYALPTYSASEPHSHTFSRGVIAWMAVFSYRSNTPPMTCAGGGGTLSLGYTRSI